MSGRKSPEEGRPSIEESVFAGIPINVTLLFSREQYLASADAYMRAIERRMQRFATVVMPALR